MEEEKLKLKKESEKKLKNLYKNIRSRKTMKLINNIKLTEITADNFADFYCNHEDMSDHHTDLPVDREIRSKIEDDFLKMYGEDNIPDFNVRNWEIYTDHPAVEYFLKCKKQKKRWAQNVVVTIDSDGTIFFIKIKDLESYLKYFIKNILDELVESLDDNLDDVFFEKRVFYKNYIKQKYEDYFYKYAEELKVFENFIPKDVLNKLIDIYKQFFKIFGEYN